MPEHTPGPWRAIDAEEAGRYWISSNRFEYVQSDVATVWGMPEAEANARLIAAAPELLEAAKLLVSLFDRGDFNDDRWEDLWDAFQAAISKAESSNQPESRKAS